VSGGSGISSSNNNKSRPTTTASKSNNVHRFKQEVDDDDDEQPQQQQKQQQGWSTSLMKKTKFFEKPKEAWDLPTLPKSTPYVSLSLSIFTSSFLLVDLTSYIFVTFSLFRITTVSG